MRHLKTKTVVVVVLLLISTIAAVAYIANRRRKATEPGRKVVTSRPTSAEQGKRPQDRARHRNLSLQPEAMAVARQLGNRFASDKRPQSVVVGTVTIGTQTRIVRTIRNQTDDGEEIEISLPGRDGVLTWDKNGGATSGASRAQGADRDLVERLVFDSADHFVLAQLRGASYFTVARNVRPADAGENYRGPLWTVVRINDPEKDESKAPQSRWRLYYIDAATGLIHRIESEVNGRRTVAELSDWVEQNGQKVPTRIAWKQDGQTVMEYRMNSFAHVDR